MTGVKSESSSAPGVGRGWCRSLLGVFGVLAIMVGWGGGEDGLLEATNGKVISTAATIGRSLTVIGPLGA